MKLLPLLPLLAAAVFSTQAAPTLLDPVHLAPGENAPAPGAAAFNPSNHKLYVLGGEVSAYHGRYGLRVVDTVAGAVTGGILISDLSNYSDDRQIAPAAVAVDRGNNTVYVLGGVNASRSYDGKLRFIDGNTDTNLTDADSDVVLPNLRVDGAVYAEALLVNPATHRVYVALSSQKIFEIDGVGRRLLNTIDVPAVADGRGAVVNSVLNKVFLLGGNPGAVINGADGSSAALTLPFSYSFAAAIDEAAGRIYVVGSDIATMTRTIYALDAASGTVLASAPLGILSDVTGLRADPATNTVYVSAYSGTSSGRPGETAAFDGSTLTLKRSYPISSYYTAVDGGRVFVLDAFGAGNDYPVGGSVFPNAIGILDPTTGATSSVTVGFTPGAPAVDAVTGRVFVYDDSADEVTVVDAASRAVLKHFPVLHQTKAGGGYVRAMTVSGKMNRFYIVRYEQTSLPDFTSKETTNVDVYDGADGHLIGTVPFVDHRDFGYVVVDDQHGRFYVSDYNDQPPYATRVAEFDLASNALLATVDVGTTEGVNGLGINPITQHLFITGGHGIGEGTVTVFDAVANKTLAKIENVGTIPTHVAVNSKTNTIYVDDHSDGSLDGSTVYVIDGAKNALSRSFSIQSAGDNHAVTDLAVDEVSGTVYVGDNYNGFNSQQTPGVVSFFDAKNGYALLGSLPTGYSPGRLAFEPKTRRVFAGNVYEGTLTALQESGGSIVPPPTGGVNLTANVTLATEQLKSSGKYKAAGTYTFANVGDIKAKHIQVGFYLSTNPTVATPVAADDPALLALPITLDSSQTPGVLGFNKKLLGFGSGAPIELPGKLKPGKRYEATFNLKLPAAALGLAQSGSFRYVIAVIDPAGRLEDADPSNNQAVIDLNAAAPK